MDNKVTSFSAIYDRFLEKITDDMYMEISEVETLPLLQEMLIAAISFVEFPRFDIYDYVEGYYDDLGDYCGVESDNVKVPAIGWIGGYFNAELTPEEKEIIAMYMVVEWLGQQLAHVDNTRMKYSGSDFKFTSQANHMAKLKVLKESYTQQGFHLQRLYKRRKRGKNGLMLSTMGQIMEEPSYGYKI